MSKKSTNKSGKPASASRNSTSGEDGAPKGATSSLGGYDLEILDELNRAATPLTPEEVAEQIGLRKRERAAFEAALVALETSGRVVRNRAGSLLVAKKLSVITGRVDGHPDGYGFLVPDDGGPSLFVPVTEMRQVLHGDRVAAKASGRDPRGRPVATIVDVLERGNKTVVGRLHAEHGMLFLVPEDRRIAQDILVPPGEAGKAKAGQVVTVELVAQPGSHSQPIGRVNEVLGNYGDSGMEIEMAVSIAVCCVSDSVATRASTSAMPSFTFTPRPSNALGWLVNTLPK